MSVELPSTAPRTGTAAHPPLAGSGTFAKMERKAFAHLLDSDVAYARGAERMGRLEPPDRASKVVDGGAASATLVQPELAWGSIATDVLGQAPGNTLASAWLASRTDTRGTATAPSGTVRMAPDGGRTSDICKGPEVARSTMVPRIQWRAVSVTAFLSEAGAEVAVRDADRRIGTDRLLRQVRSMLARSGVKLAALKLNGNLLHDDGALIRRDPVGTLGG